MAQLTESVHRLEFVLSELRHAGSRLIVTISNGEGVLAAGRVLGRVTIGREYHFVDPAAIDGTEVALAILAEDVDATSTAVDALIIRQIAEVNDGLLDWGALTAPQQATGREELEDGSGILVRV